VITILFEIASELLNLYRWAVILAAVFSMLTSFGVLDTRNRLVWAIGDFLYRITEPALRPIRNILPSFGNIDLSPLVLILLISAVQAMLPRIHNAIVFGDVHSLFL
jgi:YggT family protein